MSLNGINAGYAATAATAIEKVQCSLIKFLFIKFLFIEYLLNQFNRSHTECQGKSPFLHS